jgi:hypothetical protein
VCVASSAEISGDFFFSGDRPGRQWVERASAADEAARKHEYYEGEQEFFIDRDVGMEQPTDASRDVNIEVESNVGIAPSESTQLDDIGRFEPRYTEPADDGLCTVEMSYVAQEQVFAIDDSAREDGSI